MFNFKKIFFIKNFKKTILYKHLVFKKKKFFKFRNEKITVFHLKKKYFHILKKHTRVRKIFFYMLKKNSNRLFIFNKPKSTFVKKKRK